MSSRCKENKIFCDLKEDVEINTHQSICNILFLFLASQTPSKDLRIVPASRILSKSTPKHHSMGLNDGYNFLFSILFGCPNLSEPRICFINKHFIAFSKKAGEAGLHEVDMEECVIGRNYMKF